MSLFWSIGRHLLSIRVWVFLTGAHECSKYVLFDVVSFGHGNRSSYFICAQMYELLSLSAGLQGSDTKSHEPPESGTYISNNIAWPVVSAHACFHTPYIINVHIELVWFFEHVLRRTRSFVVGFDSNIDALYVKITPNTFVDRPIVLLLCWIWHFINGHFKL